MLNLMLHSRMIELQKFLSTVYSGMQLSLCAHVLHVCVFVCMRTVTLLICPLAVGSDGPIVPLKKNSKHTLVSF